MVPANYHASSPAGSNTHGGTNSNVRHLGLRESLQANEMRAVGGSINAAWNHGVKAWQKWKNQPSQEQIVRNRQITIFRSQLKERVVPQLNRVLSNIIDNPKNAGALKGALKSLDRIVKEFADHLKPHADEKCRKIQEKQFESLRGRIAELQDSPPDVVAKLKSKLPILFSDTERAENELERAENEVSVSSSFAGSVYNKFVSWWNQPSPESVEKKAENEKIEGLTEEYVEELSDPGARQASRAVPVCPLYDLNNLGLSGSFNLTVTQGQAGAPIVVVPMGDAIGNNGIPDGIPDFAMSNPTMNGPNGRLTAGGVWFIPGGPNVASTVLDTQVPNFFGPNQFDQLGYAMVNLPNFTGNGKIAFAMGAPNNGGGKTAVYVILDLGSQVDLTSCDGIKCFKVNGLSISDELGISLASGDINGQFPDLLMSASNTLIALFGGPAPRPPELNSTILDGGNGFVVQGPAGTGFPLPLVTGNTQANNTIPGFAAGAVAALPSSSGKVYDFNGRPSWPAMVSLNVDGTPEGFTAKAGPFEFIPAALCIGPDLLGTGKPTFIASNAANKVYFFNQPDPANAPLNLLNASNETLALQTPATVSSAVVMDLTGSGQGTLILGMSQYTPQPGLEQAGGLIIIPLQANGQLPPNLDLTSTNSTDFTLIPGVVKGGALGTSVVDVGAIKGDGVRYLAATAPGTPSKGTTYFLRGNQPSSGVCPTTTTTSPSTTAPAGTNLALTLGLSLGLGLGAFLLTGLIIAVAKLNKVWCFSGESKEVKRADVAFEV